MTTCLIIISHRRRSANMMSTLTQSNSSQRAAGMTITSLSKSHLTTISKILRILVDTKFSSLKSYLSRRISSYMNKGTTWTSKSRWKITHVCKLKLKTKLSRTQRRWKIAFNNSKKVKNSAKTILGTVQSAKIMCVLSSNSRFTKQGLS